MAHDKRFHEIILRGSGNRRLTTIVSQLRDLVRFRGASTVGPQPRPPGDPRRARRDPRRAARRATRRAPPRAMRAHLLETGRLLLAQESAPAAGLPWADVLDG